MRPDLERRYRRLLLAYPGTHRAEHAEEMLGVLLDAAGPRTRPGLADTLDVLRGGLLVRARRADAAGWGDALAVTGVVTSMLVCTLAPIGLGLLLLAEYPPVPQCLALLVWPAAVAAGLAGLHRVAAALGVAATLALVATGAVGFFPGPWVALAALAALAAVTTRPRRGWVVLGWTRALLLVTGCALVSGFLLLYARVTANHWATPYLPGPVQPREQMWILLGTGLALVAAACFRVATPAARRVTLALAAPLTSFGFAILGLMSLFDDRVRPYANPSDAQQLAVIAASLLLAVATAGLTASRRATRTA